MKTGISSGRIILTLGVFGRDRTGVVARITSFLFGHGANIDELSEKVTRGQFAMTVIASWSAKDLRRDNLESGLRQLGRELGMEVEWRYASGKAVPRMALFVTKEPECPDAILKAVKKGELKCLPVVMIGTRRNLSSLARRYNIPFVLATFRNRETAEKQVLKLLSKYEVDFCVLARFMKILSPGFVWRYRHRVINLHPSLLPAFPGASPYRQAMEKGVKVVGATAHFADESLDGGPIIAQDSFRIKADEALDSIVKRGRMIESRVLVRSVKLYLTKRLDVHWGRVYFE